MTKHIRIFDPKQVYRDHVEGRKVIYLDTMVWIQFTDQKTDVAKRAFDACLRAKELNRAIFPISYSAMGELIDQPIPENRVAQAKIMDALSSGVTFRELRHIQEVEIEAAVRFLRTEQTEEPDHSLLYSYAGDNIGDGYFQIPPTFPEDKLDDFLGLVLPRLRSVEGLITLDGVEKMQANHKGHLGRYKAEMEADRSTASDFESALWEERKYCFDRIVRPRLVELFAAQCEYDKEKIEQLFSRFRQTHGKGGPKTLALLLSHMPSTDLFAKIMAARVIDATRTVSQNDYYDTEHAQFAVYADYFFTERNLAHILNNVCKVPQFRPSLHVERGLDRLVSVCAGLAPAA